MLFMTIPFFFAFCAIDRGIDHFGFQGTYYLVHAFHNMLMVRATLGDVITTFTDFHNLEKYEPNYYAASLCFALHFYHIALYYNKLRYDDWLHHGLMIFIALPVGLILPSSTLLGYSLFFSTGLPSILDYLLLFGVRNGWVERMTEKRVNYFLNVWLRSPGCVSHAVLTLAYAFSMTENGGTDSFWQIKTLGLLPPLLMFWNGQYFMAQVVEDYALQNRESHRRLTI